MDGALTNALSVWNASRTTAAVAESVVSSDLSYQEAQADTVIWPFDSRSELVETVDQASSSTGPGDSESESNSDRVSVDDSGTMADSTEPYSGTIDQLQRVIFERVKSNLEAIGAFDTYDNSAVISSWNQASAVATQLYNWVAHSDAAVLEPFTRSDLLAPEPSGEFGFETQSYEELRTEYPEFLPDNQEDICLVMEALPVESDSYSDYHTRLTQVLYNSDRPYAEHVEFEVAASKSEIADDLITVFSTHAGMEYSEVTDRYSIRFPNREASLMAVSRASGSDHSEKRSDLVQWVSHWYRNSDAVVEINNDRPKPMGL